MTTRSWTMLMTVIFVMVASPPCTTAELSPIPYDVPFADGQAITSYMTTAYGFSHDIDRTHALSMVKPVDALHYLDGVPHNLRFYFFPTSASSLTGHVAIAVDPLGQVTKVSDPVGFNEAVQTLSLRITSAEDAMSLARDFLLLTNIHWYYWEGESGGVNQISKVDDIPFTDDIEGRVERRILERRNHLAPAECTPSAAGFEYRFFSWRPDEGAVYRHLVTVSHRGSVEHERQRLVYAYGKYTTGCSFPLDGGPEAEELAALVTGDDPEATELVVDYVLMLATSKHHLYELRLDWLREKPVLRSALMTHLPDTALSFRRRLEKAVKVLR